MRYQVGTCEQFAERVRRYGCESLFVFGRERARINVLGGQFEYGVSWERPTILPIWEAQVREVSTEELLPLTPFPSCSLETFSMAHR